MSKRPARAGHTAAPQGLEAALALHQSGRLPEAEAAYRQILARTPGHTEAMALLGVTLAQSGAVGAGIPHLERANERQPGNPTFLHNLAVAYEKAGRLEDAEAMYARAAKADGGSAESWSARGGVLTALGRAEEAVACLREATERTPGDAATWNDLGIALEQSGNTAEAGAAFLRALSLDPARPLEGANPNRALTALLYDGTRSGTAALSDVLDVLWRHVQAEPEDPPRWANFVEVFRSVSVDDADKAHLLMPVLLRCLLEDRVDPHRVLRLALSILRHHATTAGIMQAGATGDDALDAALAREPSWPALAEPAVRLLLERTVVPDGRWEALFTRVRRHLAVERVPDADKQPLPTGMVPVAFSVARQCFHNGYVWTYDADEQTAVETMVRAMADRPLGSEPGDPLRIAVLAAYVPLIQWERAAEVLEWSERAGDETLAALVRQQIVDPAQEEELKDLIPSFGALATQVSAEVQKMYEEHPYPRWLKLPRAKPAPFAAAMRTRFQWIPTGDLPEVSRPRVLVAGCGTGQHLLHVAGTYTDADVTGVDLSRASLAYAIRKAAEMGFEDVSVVQADILALDAWTEPFHLIECAGVLHHMEDPMAGWRVLTDLLTPGGFMRIGLYSEAARQSVVRARDFIARNGWSPSDEEIRLARPEIARFFADSPEESPANWRDFFSMHECRDLLFHVQEHRFTVPRIAEALETLGLEFLAWDGLTGSTLARFRQEFPDPADARSLQAWDRFEQEHPSTFSSMYQFWVRKPAP